MSRGRGRAGRQLKLPQRPLHSQDFGKTLRSPGRASARLDLTSVTLRSADALCLGFSQKHRCSQPGAGRGRGDGGRQNRRRPRRHEQCPARCPGAGLAPAGVRAQACRQPAPAEGSVLRPGGACGTAGRSGGDGNGGTSTPGCRPTACPWSRATGTARPPPPPFPYRNLGFCAWKGKNCPPKAEFPPPPLPVPAHSSAS